MHIAKYPIYSSAERISIFSNNTKLFSIRTEVLYAGVRSYVNLLIILIWMNADGVVFGMAAMSRAVSQE